MVPYNLMGVTNDVEVLNAVSDPAQRAAQALATIEQGRLLMEKAAEVRARAAFELYQKHGAPKAARLLGISRVNLYRIVGQVPEVRQQRLNRNIELGVLAITTLASVSGSTTPNSEGVNQDAIQ
jgi:hypothetical protein